MGDYRKLKVWRMAHGLTISIYHGTRDFPAEEKFGLASQMRRAAVSVTSNIAEGCGRNRNAEMARFVRHAMGSCTELEYQVLLCEELRFISPPLASDLNHVTTQLRAMLASLHRRLAGIEKLRGHV